MSESAKRQKTETGMKPGDSVYLRLPSDDAFRQFAGRKFQLASEDGRIAVLYPFRGTKVVKEAPIKIGLRHIVPACDDKTFGDDSRLKLALFQKFGEIVMKKDTWPLHVNVHVGLKQPIAIRLDEPVTAHGSTDGLFGRKGAAAFRGRLTKVPSSEASGSSEAPSAGNTVHLCWVPAFSGITEGSGAIVRVEGGGEMHIRKIELLA